jgi:hypothetical protein
MPGCILTVGMRTASWLPVLPVSYPCYGSHMPFLLALCVFVASIPLVYWLDPDFGWHIYLGKLMYQQHQLIGTLEGYGPAFRGLRLPDHEWLAHLLLYPVYAKWGYVPFIALTALALWLALFIADSDAKRRNRAMAYRLLGILPFLLSLAISYGVRLQVSLLPAAAALGWIARSKLKAGQRQALYFFILLIGSNLHAGFLPLALIPLLLETSEWKKKPTRAQLRTYLLTAGLIGIAVAIKPFGTQYWKMIWEYLSDPRYKVEIQEWRSALLPPVYWLNAILPLIVSFSFLIFQGTFRRLARGEQLLLLGFAYMGMTHLRFLIIFFLVAAPALVQGAGESFSIRKEHLPRLNLAVGGLAFLWILYRLSGTDWSRVTDHIPQVQGAESYPQAALERLAATGCQGTLLLPFGWGGYSLGLFPQFPVMMDGRPPELHLPSGESLLATYDALWHAQDAQPVGGLLQRYGIGCVLLDRPVAPPLNRLDKLAFEYTDSTWQKLNAIPHGLRDYLEATPAAWDKAYEDSGSTLYVRKPAQP